MKTRSVAGACALAVVVALAAPAAKAQAQVSVPVTFPVGTNTFTGNFDITKFISQNGALAAVGTLTGTVTNAAGTVLATVSQALTLPVSALSVSGDCSILHLELGPLDLNLLGLKIHLDKVVLDISAESGPGNLLGNLLCAVSNLLNRPGGTVNGLVGLLNNILRAL